MGADHDAFLVRIPYSSLSSYAIFGPSFEYPANAFMAYTDNTLDHIFFKNI